MPSRLPAASSWEDIRPWEGRKSRAFEEICFQLRDPEPSDVELRKTNDPDAGFEWYWRYPDGREAGWQCKFIPDEKTLIAAMKVSFSTVARRRPNARQITFCISRDFADDPDKARGKFGWQRFDEACVEWAEEAPHIEVKLLQAGQLLERLTRPEHRGREWFWFGRPAVLDRDWCRSQWDLAVKSARERYRPALNVELPVASTLAAVAAPDGLRTHFERHVQQVLTQCRQALSKAARDAPYAEGAARLREVARKFEADAATPWDPAHTLASGFSSTLDDLRAAASRLLEVSDVEAAAASTATRELASENEPTPAQRLIKGQAEARGYRARAVEREVVRVLSTSYELREFVAGPAIAAAREGMLLLDGGGGNGKTHLCCDVGRQLLDEGHPVLLLLGQWFGTNSPWATLAERLGDPGLGWQDICGALEAAAQASGKRAVLLIDAINEAGDARMWAKHLDELRARLTGSGWVSIGLTCRTTYLPVVQPRGGVGGHVVRATHPGFQGREFEAVEHIFAAFNLQEPRVPLLLPEFTNPLFLILYCEAQARGNLPPGGAAHLTAVFTAFVKACKPDIENALDLDPARDLVGRAVHAFAQRLAAAGNDHLPYEEAQALIDAIAPGHVKWPNTLFGLMLSEGLLSRDYAYFGPDDHGEAVRFPYQRFSDHLIVEAMLDEHLDPTDIEGSFVTGKPLAKLVSGRRIGLLEALAIQLPERCEVEVPALIGEPLDDSQRDFWCRRQVLNAFVNSVAARDPKAVSHRVAELLEAAMEHGLEDEVVGAIVAVAAVRDHPLNAHWLHQLLESRTLADRDAFWTKLTYHAYGTTGHPLDRLIRWASRGPYPAYPTEVVLLAATPLVWLLASPNRFARDQTTKALVELLRDRLDVAAQLVHQFAAIDDVYITERLAAVSYACLLRSDPAQVEATQAIDLLRELGAALDKALPNVLMRDHVAGYARWMSEHLNVTDPALIAAALPPYGSKPPKMPRREAWLEKAYPRGGSWDEPGYSALHSSVLSDFGDFGGYVVRHRVENFLARRLTDPEPAPVAEPSEAEQQVDEQRLAVLLASLGYAQTTSLENDDTESVRDSLSDEQVHPLRRSVTTPTSERRRRRTFKSDKYPMDRAKRFIFQRCIELGWTPELFGAFDISIGRSDSGRSAHKPERFGKKYQWIALLELLARLADNYVLGDWNDHAIPYEGAWQLSCRDIDPTLPVGQITIDSEDERHRALPFRQDPIDVWWVPPGPHFDEATRNSAEWAQRTDDLPDVSSLFVQVDEGGNRYVVLGGRFEYVDDPNPDTSMTDPADRPRRDFGMPLEMAFARKSDLDSLVAWLQKHPDPLRSVPGWHAQAHGESYLGETPWAASASENRADWTREAYGRQAKLPVDVIAPTVPWTASGNDFDCSLDESVSISVPSSYLRDLGRLRWDGEALAWLADGQPVIFYRETDEGWNRDWVVLADERWLLNFLERNQLILLCTAFAERRMFRPDSSRPEPMGWVDLGAAAVLAKKTWTIREWQVIWDRRSGEDPQ